jgi:hypothetical protein
VPRFVNSAFTKHGYYKTIVPRFPEKQQFNFIKAFGLVGLCRANFSNFKSLWLKLPEKYLLHSKMDSKSEKPLTWRHLLGDKAFRRKITH